MNRDTTTTAPQTATRIARLAWLCAFVLPLVLATALLGVRSTQAQAPQPTVVPFALDEFEEEELALEGEEELEGDEEAGFAEAECEIAEEEAEEGEITQAEADALCAEVEGLADAGRSTATPCPIRTARAHASLKGHKLKLTIGYTTSTPTRATIQIPKVGTYKRKLGRSGVIRIAKNLAKRQPRRVVVSIKAPSCAKPKISTTKVRQG